MKTTKRAVFDVTPEFLAQAIHMPDDHEIIGVEWRFNPPRIKVFVRGPCLPDVQEGEIIPTVVPVITKTTDEETGRESYIWELGKK